MFRGSFQCFNLLFVSDSALVLECVILALSTLFILAHVVFQIVLISYKPYGHFVKPCKCYDISMRHPSIISEENHSLLGAKAYREHCQTCKMEPFAEINNRFQWLTIFAKSSILDVWQGFKYSSRLSLSCFLKIVTSFSKLFRHFSLRK